MTITQTIDITDDYEVMLKIPRSIPKGKARIEMRVIPFVKQEDKPLQKGKSATPHTDALLSLLSGIGEVNVDEIRDERLAKHLK
jgi:hypothetical protein